MFTNFQSISYHHLPQVGPGRTNQNFMYKKTTSWLQGFKIATLGQSGRVSHFLDAFLRISWQIRMNHVCHFQSGIFKHQVRDQNSRSASMLNPFWWNFQLLRLHHLDFQSSPTCSLGRFKSGLKIFLAWPLVSIFLKRRLLRSLQALKIFFWADFPEKLPLSDRKVYICLKHLKSSFIKILKKSLELLLTWRLD